MILVLMLLNAFSQATAATARRTKQVNCGQPTSPEIAFLITDNATWAGWAIHGAVHRNHPHVNAACHAHTIAGKAWSATGRRLQMVEQDVCKFYGEAQALYSDYGGVVLGTAMGEGEAIAKALGPKGKGAILANHGLLTVGETVDEAGFLFGLLDRSCRVQLELAKSGIEPVVIGDREAEFNFRMESRPVRSSKILTWCMIIYKLTNDSGLPVLGVSARFRL